MDQQVPHDSDSVARNRRNRCGFEYDRKAISIDPTAGDMNGWSLAAIWLQYRQPSSHLGVCLASGMPREIT